MAFKSPISWKTVQNCRLPFVALTLALVIAVTFISNHNTENNLVKETAHTTHPSKTLQSTVRVQNQTIEIVNGTEIIWEKPPNPKAILYMAHGSEGSARNFWVKSLNCPKCVGLPEETRLVNNALDKEYAVVVVSSTDTTWTYGEEKIGVARIIKWWLKKNGLEKLPLFGLGASAGGYFLSTLALEVKFRAIVVMISSGLYDQMGRIQSGYPPTLFLHMPKDVELARKVIEATGVLRKAGVEVEEIKCMEVPVTPHWLSERISGLDLRMSYKVVKALRDQGYVDSSGYMKSDGRDTPWREALMESNVVLPDESNLELYIQEELNLAYGFHEMTSLKSKEIFEWFELYIGRKESR